MKYRKKPVVIDAFQWTENQNQTEDRECIVNAIKNKAVSFTDMGTPNAKMLIKTLEGVMTTDRGDFIIRGVDGEIYPCKPDIFRKTYEKVEKNHMENLEKNLKNAPEIDLFPNMSSTERFIERCIAKIQWVFIKIRKGLFKK